MWISLLILFRTLPGGGRMVLKRRTRCTLVIMWTALRLIPLVSDQWCCFVQLCSSQDYLVQWAVKLETLPPAGDHHLNKSTQTLHTVSHTTWPTASTPRDPWHQHTTWPTAPTHHVTNGINTLCDLTQKKHPHLTSWCLIKLRWNQAVNVRKV
jgi:hypothetical protein